MFLKLIACEIAARELQYVAARSPNLIDLEFLTQGHHDTPATGRKAIQERIEAVPVGKYDAIVLGYALCSNILTNLRTLHTPLLIPRAHDCITFFLGSRARYDRCFSERPGTYYFTAGWLECAARRGGRDKTWTAAASPANSRVNLEATYQHWIEKYGEEQAKYLLDEMNRWSEVYSSGCLVDFDFLDGLRLDEKVKQICAEKDWSYEEIPGDLSLIEKMVNGPWTDEEFLKVEPRQVVVPTFDERIIAAKACNSDSSKS